MQNRKPIYRDLLDHGIEQKDLDTFMGNLKLRKSDGSLEPVTETTEIDQPVNGLGTLPPRDYFYPTALCYATDTNNIKMVQALLNAGAHPNIVNDDCIKGSALILALLPKSPKPEILALFLKMPDIDIYVTAVGRTAFSCTEGNQALILRLLEADSDGVAALLSEEKTSMATAIATRMQSYYASYAKQANPTSRIVCQNVRKAYPTDEEKEVFRKEINQGCGFPLNAPQGSIVVSYLFKPKPESLKVMESWCGNGMAQLEEGKPNEAGQKSQQRRSCSVM